MTQLNGSSKTMLEKLLPVWHRNQDSRERISNQFARKSLDLPDPMDIQANKSGIGAPGLIAAMLAAAGIGLGGAYLGGLSRGGQPATVPTQPTQTATPPSAPTPQPIYRDRVKRDTKTGAELSREPNAMRIWPDGTIEIKQADGTWKKE